MTGPQRGNRFIAMNVPLLKQAVVAKPTPLIATLAPGAYLTDERRLFCCLSRDPIAGADEMVLLEDCATLKVFIHPAEDLAAADMRLVKP